MSHGTSQTERLILWDVDGTLISTLPGVEDVYRAVLDGVIGLPAEDFKLNTHGKTDAAILATAARDLGLNGPLIELVLPVLISELEMQVDLRFDRYRRDCSVLPGISTTLQWLAEEGVCNGIVSGNTRRNCLIKIERFGLSKHIDTWAGAFGDESRDRSKLVRMCIERARVLRGIDLPKDRVMVVGDTPLDALAARTAGVKVVLVATGAYSLEELRRSTPDLLIRDFDRDNDAFEAFLADDGDR